MYLCQLQRVLIERYGQALRHLSALYNRHTENISPIFEEKTSNKQYKDLIFFFCFLRDTFIFSRLPWQIGPVVMRGTAGKGRSVCGP